MSKQARIEKVTPSKAKKWLGTQIAPRKLAYKRVIGYSEALKNDQWEINGDTICFNTHGNMIDGQHRCAAVILSGVDMWAYVARGLSDSAHKTIDIAGGGRTIDQLLQMRGCAIHPRSKGTPTWRLSCWLGTLPKQAGLRLS